MKISFTIPMALPSVANLREHWSKRAARAKQHRMLVNLHRPLFRPLGNDSAVVTITRLAPRRLDSDNLQGACKALRDGVADCMGVKDNHPRVTWVYLQWTSKIPTVRIEVVYVGTA